MTGRQAWLRTVILSRRVQTVPLLSRFRLLSRNERPKGGFSARRLPTLLLQDYVCKSDLYLNIIDFRPHIRYESVYHCVRLISMAFLSAEHDKCIWKIKCCGWVRALRLMGAFKYSNISNLEAVQTCDSAPNNLNLLCANLISYWMVYGLSDLGCIMAG